MRSIEQIIAANGGDNTPGMDTHNLTGRAFPEGVEELWTPYDYGYDEDEGYAPLATLDELLDCE